VAELAWALGWEIVFILRKPQQTSAQIPLSDTAQTGTKALPFTSNNALKTEGVSIGRAYDFAA
jgi:hypothetical protein